MHRHRRDWVLLVALAVIWGTSFAANRVAVGVFTPGTVVWGRLGIAAVLLLALARGAGLSMPRGRGVWLHLALLAVVGNALPFFLISWGQQRIDSGLAGVLMAVMPLATMLLAHVFVEGERLHRRGLTGFLLGFVGIVALVGPEALSGIGDGRTAVVAQIAVLGGALCYAANTIFARHLAPMHILVSSASTLAIAAAIMTPVGISGIWAQPVWDPVGLANVVWLGVFSTALATVIYFRIVTTAGPTFLSLINYLIPVIAVVVGVVALAETPEPRMLVALVVILLGVGLSQRGEPSA
ncbi:MAG: drug/metabolite transporter (DMT)-like permease [Hyphomicrobiaceae bacterium]|jgi:drug/metabolite transporter (DMT)-like permease